ncbi:hypothetical protein CLBKND_01060 [Methylorubrum aminovorans]
MTMWTTYLVQTFVLKRKRLVPGCAADGAVSARLATDSP